MARTSAFELANIKKEEKQMVYTLLFMNNDENKLIK